jgi:Fe-S oxidoreductase
MIGGEAEREFKLSLRIWDMRVRKACSSLDRAPVQFKTGEVLIARERSFCCGAGGGLAVLGEKKGDRMSHTRAKELAATGASIMGTACPFCNAMFHNALSALSNAPPRLWTSPRSPPHHCRGARVD